MTSKKHSTLGASSAGRWINCPGSVKLCAKLPKEPPGAYADEGTAAHLLSEQRILASLNRTTAPISKYYAKYINEDMKDYAFIYSTLVLKHAKGLAKALFVEEKFDLDWLHPGMFGTCDAAIVEAFGILDVFDLKYGKGVVVEVEQNAQQMYYALGALKKFGIDTTYVRMWIIQPRAAHSEGPIRNWTITAEELLTWGEEVLKPAAIATEVKDAPCIVGPWCNDYFCPGLKQSKCKALKKEALALAKLDFESIPETITLPDINTLDTAELARVMEFTSILSTWSKEVAAHVQSLLEKGKDVPGYKLIAKRATRKYKNPANAEVELRKDFGNAIYKPHSLLGIGDMEKLIGKEKMAEICHKPPAGVTVASISDKRPAITNSAALDFEPVK